jgi:hypothetical protein
MPLEQLGCWLRLGASHGEDTSYASQALTEPLQVRIVRLGWGLQPLPWWVIRAPRMEVPPRCLKHITSAGVRAERLGRSSALP